MNLFKQNSDEDNNRFIIEVAKDLVEYKEKLYEQLEQNGESIEKVLPMYHVLLHLFTYFKFTDKNAMKALA
jgi:hypothetical protein